MATKAELYAEFQRLAALHHDDGAFIDATQETPRLSSYGVAVVMLGLYSSNVYGNLWQEPNGRLTLRDHYRHGWGRAEATGGITITFYPDDTDQFVRSVTIPAGYTPGQLVCKLNAFVRLIRRA